MVTFQCMHVYAVYACSQKSSRILTILFCVYACSQKSKNTNHFVLGMSCLSLCQENGLTGIIDYVFAVLFLHLLFPLIISKITLSCILYEMFCMNKAIIFLSN